MHLLNSQLLANCVDVMWTDYEKQVKRFKSTGAMKKQYDRHYKKVLHFCMN